MQKSYVGLREQQFLHETVLSMSVIDPDELLLAYRIGVFPMAETRDAPDVLWVRPKTRCILPLDNFHVPKRLARTIRSDRFEVRCDTAFESVIRGCASTGPQRDESWINPAIADAFKELHERGLAHSVETWDKGELVGGLYGLSIGAAFFGESMFSQQTDASKVALVHLAARLKRGSYRLLDAQFPNPHLEQFGAMELSEREFDRLLADAVASRADFYSFDASASVPAIGSSSDSTISSAKGSSSENSSVGSGGGASVMQVMTHTS